MADDGPSADSPAPATRSVADGALSRLRSMDRTLAALLAVTALSLAIRLYGLGSRIAQWDEGRVAYWVLRYQETGAWEYRPIVHGPFLFHVDKWVFTLFGANDFTMRLVVAVVGGLLPLSAWLFREHLRRDELVALALVFAANPLLIYYSRFFRNDVLLAAFMVFSLGLFVRAYDTRAPKYLYGGAAMLALGFTTKENALVYPLCWLGAGALLLDHRLFRISERARRATASARDRARAATDGGTEAPDDEADDDEADDDEATPPDDEDDGATPSADEYGASTTDEHADRDEFAAPDEEDDRTAPSDGPTGRTDPMAYVAEWLEPAAARLYLPAAVAVLVLNPYGVTFAGDLLTWLAGLVFGGVGRIGFAVLAPVGLAAGGLAVVAALDRQESPGSYAAVVVSYAAAVGLWALGAGPDVATVTYVLVYGLWLALLADVALFDADAPLSGSVPVGYAVFFAIVVFFYAPRAGDTGGIGLYATLSAPETAPAVLYEAVIGSWEEFLDTWAATSHQEHAYLPFFFDYLERLRAVAVVTVLAGMLGFVYDRYVTGGPRDVVALGAYWGGASVLGYPLITDLMSPWSVVHSVVPLAFPAAVGLALLYRQATAVDLDRPVRTTVAVVLVVALVGWTAGTAYDANVAAPDERRNEAFVHWTQPENELRYTLQTVGQVAEENEAGHDVLFFGSRRGGGEQLFYVADESVNDRPPAGGGWYDRLPLPWYLERYGANVTSSAPTADAAEVLSDPPPVVIAYAWDRNRVTPYMDGYVLFTHDFKLYNEEILVFVDADYLDGYGSGAANASAAMTRADATGTVAAA
jgi:uncharacterized protein (TIGR03663 family)